MQSGTKSGVKTPNKEESARRLLCSVQPVHRPVDEMQEVLVPPPAAIHWRNGKAFNPFGGFCGTEFGFYMPQRASNGTTAPRKGFDL